MSDPNLAVAEPGPTAAPAPELPLLPLAELFPACFDRENPRPLKIDIHRDLMAAGHDRIAVKRALGRYCKADRYRKALQIGAARIDLHGQPAGAVTEREAAHARSLVEARAAARESLPPNATPIPKEHLVPGRLELTAKFSELPKPLNVQGGVKIGVQTAEGTVTAILPTKVWRKLEQAAKDYPQWVAALSGSLARFADGEIVLQHPALQIFERKARPEAEPARAAEASPTMPKPAATPAPAAAPKPPEAKAPAAPASNPNILRATLSLKGQRKP